MHYVVQENLFKEYNYRNLLETLERFDFSYEVIKMVKGDFEAKSDRKDVFCFGAVMMAIAARRKGWKYGSMLDDNHDIDIYSEKFGNHNMLNGEYYVAPFNLDIFTGFLNEFFVKPVKDNKAFTGKVFTKESWREFYNNFDNSRKIIKMTKEDIVLVAPVKKIQQEVRCWVVGGKVVTASLYKRGKDVIYKNYDNETFYTDFAQKMVDKHQLAHAFVIDICLVDDELKIIEVNNINSAGFYDCNMNNLLSSIDTYFENLYTK